MANICSLTAVTLPDNAIKVAQSIVATPVGAIPPGVFSCDTANNYAGTLTATCTESGGVRTATVTRFGNINCKVREDQHHPGSVPIAVVVPLSQGARCQRTELLHSLRRQRVSMA